MHKSHSISSAQIYLKWYWHATWWHVHVHRMPAHAHAIAAKLPAQIILYILSQSFLTHAHAHASMTCLRSGRPPVPTPSQPVSPGSARGGRQKRPPTFFDEGHPTPVTPFAPPVKSPRIA